MEGVQRDGSRNVFNRGRARGSAMGPAAIAYTSLYVTL